MASIPWRISPSLTFSSVSLNSIFFLLESSPGHYTGFFYMISETYRNLYPETTILKTELVISEQVRHAPFRKGGNKYRVSSPPWPLRYLDPFPWVLRISCSGQHNLNSWCRVVHLYLIRFHFFPWDLNCTYCNIPSRYKLKIHATI